MWKEEEGSRLELYADEKGEDGRRAHAVGRASPRKQLEGLRDVAQPQEEPLRNSYQDQDDKENGFEITRTFFLGGTENTEAAQAAGAKGGSV